MERAECRSALVRASGENLHFGSFVVSIQGATKSTQSGVSVIIDIHASDMVKKLGGIQMYSGNKLKENEFLLYMYG